MEKNFLGTWSLLILHNTNKPTIMAAKAKQENNLVHHQHQNLKYARLTKSAPAEQNPLLLLLLFSGLPVPTLNTLSRVCSFWNKVIKQYHLKALARLRDKLAKNSIALPTSLVFQIFKLTKFNEDEALALLNEYSNFRISHFSSFDQPQNIIASEWSSRKVIWWLPDKKNRPCLVIRPKFHIPQKKEMTMLLAIHLFEKACDKVWKMGVDDFCVILDFEGFSAKNWDYKFARKFIQWSRKFYKNLLGACYCIRTPWYAIGCWSLIKHFVPSITLQKIFICKGDSEWKKVLQNNFDIHTLPTIYGGTIHPNPCLKLDE